MSLHIIHMPSRLCQQMLLILLRNTNTPFCLLAMHYQTASIHLDIHSRLDHCCQKTPRAPSVCHELAGGFPPSSACVHCAAAPACWRSLPRTSARAPSADGCFCQILSSGDDIFHRGRPSRADPDAASLLSPSTTTPDGSSRDAGGDGSVTV